MCFDFFSSRRLLALVQAEANAGKRALKEMRKSARAPKIATRSYDLPSYAVAVSRNCQKSAADVACIRPWTGNGYESVKRMASCSKCLEKANKQHALPGQ